nr:pirin family protein [uncultured Roseococcus sp.]
MENAALPPSIETLILPRSHDVGGFEVRRALPTKERQMIGPFIFFDQMGPGEFLTGRGLDVRPHPHIGLSTVTYLFEGEVFHRDTLGSAQAIRPGALNWMTAGQGIAHSERTATELRSHPNKLFGIQSWAALPKDREEMGPTFTHYPAEGLPVLEESGARVRLVAGEAWGARAPVETWWPLFYADVELRPGAAWPLPDGHEERGAYVVSGTVEVAGQRFEAGRMLVFRAGDALAIRALEAAEGGGQGARLLLLGGAVMDGPRHIFWNFVSSSRDRINQAKDDWEAGRFGQVPGDDKEFIPLPRI